MNSFRDFVPHPSCSVNLCFLFPSISSASFISEGSYLQFMSDEFLRLLLCRHVFASVVLRVHRSFRSRLKNHPPAHPPLPDLDVVENPTLQRYTLDLAMQGIV